MKLSQFPYRSEACLRAWYFFAAFGGLAVFLVFRPLTVSGGERPAEKVPARREVQKPAAAPQLAAPSTFSEPMIRVLTALSEDFLVTSNRVRKKPNLALFQHLSRTTDSPLHTLAVTYTNMHGTFESFNELAQQIGFARLKNAQLAFIQGFFTYAAGASYDQQVHDAERRGFAPPDEPPGRSTVLQPVIDARSAQLAPFEAQRNQWQREAASLYHELVDETRRLVDSATSGLPQKPTAILAKPDPRTDGLPGHIMVLNVSTQTLHHCVVFATGIKDRARILGAEMAGAGPPADEETRRQIEASVDFQSRDHRLIAHIPILPPRIPVYIQMGDRNLMSILQTATVEIYCDELVTGSLLVGDLSKRAFEIEAARIEAQERAWSSRGRPPLPPIRPPAPAPRR